MQEVYLGQAIGMKSQREPVASGVSCLQGSVEREQGVTPGHRAHPSWPSSHSLELPPEGKVLSGKVSPSLLCSRATQENRRSCIQAMGPPSKSNCYLE